ncbi:MAG: hypothetical protein FJX46_06815 [Alphaproteobacteria bacterium]|nr:hypothetical protein [Alphaproteobacteria bacterium]
MNLARSVVPAELTVSTDLKDRVTRALWPIDKVIHYRPLFDLFQVWSACRAGRGGIPGLEVLQSAEMRETTLAERVNVIDLSHPNPFHFRILNHSEISTRQRRSNFRDRTFGEIASRPHGDGLQIDYNTVKMTQAPRLQMIVNDFDDEYCEYLRLILPISSNGPTQVDRALAGIVIVNDVAPPPRFE